MVLVNGKIYPYQLSNRGIVLVKLPNDARLVIVSYRPSVALMVGYLVAVISWLVLVYAKLFRHQG